MKKAWTILIAVVLAALVAFSACANDSPNVNADNLPAYLQKDTEQFAKINFSVKNEQQHKQLKESNQYNDVEWFERVYVWVQFNENFTEEQWYTDYKQICQTNVSKLQNYLFKANYDVNFVHAKEAYYLMETDFGQKHAQIVAVYEKGMDFYADYENIKTLAKESCVKSVSLEYAYPLPQGVFAELDILG